MGIGNNPRSAHGETGAVRDGENLLSIMPDDNHPNDAARRCFDIRRIGECRRWVQSQGAEEQGEEGNNTMHMAAASIAVCIDRKLREAQLAGT